MLVDLNEVGVTNLGPVPHGMTFYEAIKDSADLRKYSIDAHRHTQRLTVCEVQREIYRIADLYPDIPDDVRLRLKELATAGYDMGKRMDKRMRELKACLHP